MKPAEIIQTDNQNLFVLPGHISISSAESQLSVALSTGLTALPALQNLPGSLSHMLRLTAEENDVDVILLDLSPSVGAFNECALMGSDYFLIPTSPDYFCNQAIFSIADVIPRWVEQTNPFRNPSISYRLPEKLPKFIGYISQKYRPRNDLPAKSFQKWIDIIENSVNTILIPRLKEQGMIADPHEQYVSFEIAQIADFNSLIAKSQEHHTPVFALSDKQLDAQGAVLDTAKNKRKVFKEVFEAFAQEVIQRTY